MSADVKITAKNVIAAIALILGVGFMLWGIGIFIHDVFLYSFAGGLCGLGALLAFLGSILLDKEI